MKMAMKKKMKMKMKICACLTEKTAEDCIKIGSKIDTDLVEHRMDFMEEIGGLDEIYSSLSMPVIATNRSINCGGRFRGGEEERIDHLLDAIDAGCGLVDVEIDTPPELKKALIQRARQRNCRVIISMHDFEKTPSTEKLIAILRNEKEQGADIGKIVTLARSIQDCHRVLGLILGADRLGLPLVAFAMGPLGKFTRIIAPMYGAPFTYASINAKAEESQFDVIALREIYKKLT